VRRLSIAVTALAALFAALLLAWAVWLIATPDEDGGRRPAGLFMLAFTVVVVAIAWFLARPGRRTNRRR